MPEDKRDWCECDTCGREFFTEHECQYLVLRICHHCRANAIELAKKEGRKEGIKFVLSRLCEERIVKIKPSCDPDESDERITTIVMAMPKHVYELCKKEVGEDGQG